MINDENKGKKLSKEEAKEKIISWAEILFVDPETEEFSQVEKEINFFVRLGRLDFNGENFTYALISPIEKEGADNINIVEIRELTMGDKRSYDNYKEGQSVQQATDLMAKSCGISVGVAYRLKERDVRIINAVVLGFFVQARRL